MQRGEDIKETHNGCAPQHACVIELVLNVDLERAPLRALDELAREFTVGEYGPEDDVR